VLLIIEDLHWADHATRDLLRYLSRNLHASAALIATYRGEELPLHYPVRKLVADLHRHPGCQHLRLPPLTESELRELAEAILGHPAAADLVRELAARAQGTRSTPRSCSPLGIRACRSRINPYSPVLSRAMAAPTWLSSAAD
jgi:predicted ATPase